MLKEAIEELQRERGEDAFPIKIAIIIIIAKAC